MSSNDLNVKNNCNDEAVYKKVNIGIALLPLSPLFMMLAIYIRWAKISIRWAKVGYLSINKEWVVTSLLLVLSGVGIEALLTPLLLYLVLRVKIFLLTITYIYIYCLLTSLVLREVEFKRIQRIRK